MNKLIKDNLSDSKKHFYPTGVLAEVIGRMSGNVQTMRDINLDSLDKDYYADRFDELIDVLTDLREYMFDINQYMIPTDKKY